MTAIQGNLKKKKTGVKVIPNTIASAVYDEAKEQALSATLAETPDYSALGYPAFATTEAYTAGQVVYKDNTLYIFTSDHEAGAWNSAEVDEYSIKDILDVLAATVGGDKFTVIAEALTFLDARLKVVEELLVANADLPDLRVSSIDAGKVLVCGYPLTLRSETAGAPSAANVPVNWNEATMGIWRGVPMFPGQMYNDEANGKVYVAVKVTNSTGDWKVLN
jgi:hypothetical protein